MKYGPQRPEPFADEEDIDEEEEEASSEEETKQSYWWKLSKSNEMFAMNRRTDIANRMIPKNLRII